MDSEHVKTLDWKHVFLVVVGKNGLLAFALDVGNRSGQHVGQDSSTSLTGCRLSRDTWYIYIYIY